MGQARIRRQRFFTEHPNCCFCGGDVAATTQDHQPGRLFFDDRKWPKDFVFPACVECNRLSRDSEKLLRVLAVPDGQDDANLLKWKRTLQHINKTRPELIPSLFSSTREIRGILRDQGIEKPDGVLLRDIPIMKLDPTLWDKHFETVGRKLLLALHYQCFKKPLSKDGELWLLYSTNAQHHELTEIFANLANNLAVPIAQGDRIGNQFSLRWGMAPDAAVAAWAVQLHMRVFFFGVSLDDGKWLKNSDKYFIGERFRCFGVNG